MDVKSEENATTRDPYAVLGVSRTASLAEIREAYWRQVRFHSMGNDPSLRLQELREAYETLTDPSRRAAFDSPADGEAVYAPLPGAAPLPAEPTPAQRDTD